MKRLKSRKITTALRGGEVRGEPPRGPEGDGAEAGPRAAPADRAQAAGREAREAGREGGRPEHENCIFRNFSRCTPVF